MCYLCRALPSGRQPGLNPSVILPLIHTGAARGTSVSRAAPLLSTLSPKTIRRHVNNLWLLGGEIIRDLHYDPSLRKKAADRFLRNVMHEDGGPAGSQRLGGGAAVLRHYLPQTPPLPHSIAALSPAVTRKFPGGGDYSFEAGGPSFLKSAH
jgi:hypothetical protein